jgi:bifunctional DNase/RNase
MYQEMKVTGIAIDPFTNSPIVILKSEDGMNVLPIWVGFMEASSIAMELEKTPRVRPITHDLIKNIIDQINFKLTKIEVTDLKDNTFYANIYLQKNGKEHIFDARPSDAIAIAIRTGAPIFVNEKVIEIAQKIEFEENDEKLKNLLSQFSDDDFGNYKM